MGHNYLDLEDHFKSIHNLCHAASLLHWDHATNIPDGSHDARIDAMTELSVLIHKQATALSAIQLIRSAKDETDLSDWERRNVALADEHWKEDSKIPAQLVEKLDLAASRAESAWRTMKIGNDWESFRPFLEEIVDLKKEVWEIFKDDYKRPMDYHIHQYQPGLSADTVEKVFSELKTFLKDFIPEAAKRNTGLVNPLPKMDEETSWQLYMEIAKMMNFDFENGRMDVSAHPFTGMVPEDVRITTWHKPDWTSGAWATIHEVGHGKYEQNLPRKWISQPVGHANGIAIHESQSLIHDLIISRTPEMLAKLATMAGVAPSDLERHIKCVKPSFIRVDADAVTYPMHVIMRYEIEQELFEGNLKVSEIPALWNSKMQEYLGINPGNNHQLGCMQDIHWPSGTFGYFPSYTIGAVIAAQLWERINAAIPTLSFQLENGDFSEIDLWLNKHIWSKAKFHDFDELIWKATGQDLSAKSFINYLKATY